ncbi:MAG TPA: bifunctional adenosylcobinamide kinase/adenosylcobinamide-phosphate guanylyltransferase [Burkholderiaceae bacterium]|jgi:adenosylcobinamide kinase/adenosylcobinamide-phosphate guanylyltransferase
MTTTLILGGARSGKSRHAETLAQASGKHVIYIATAQAADGEMAERIALHRAQRNALWTTVEETHALGAAIETRSAPECVILVDCVTLWLSNLLFDKAANYPEVGPITPPERFHCERESLLVALQKARGDVILVSNEVGSGIVPSGAVSRWFVDEAGRLNQDLARICDRALLIVAGLPLALKG